MGRRANVLNQRACSTNIKLANEQPISTSETHATVGLERVLQDTGVPQSTITRMQMLPRGSIHMQTLHELEFRELFNFTLSWYISYIDPTA